LGPDAFSAEPPPRVIRKTGTTTLGEAVKRNLASRVRWTGAQYLTKPYTRPAAESFRACAATLMKGRHGRAKEYCCRLLSLMNDEQQVAAQRRAPMAEDEGEAVAKRLLELQDKGQLAGMCRVVARFTGDRKPPGDAPLYAFEAKLMKDLNSKDWFIELRRAGHEPVTDKSAKAVKSTPGVIGSALDCLDLKLGELDRSPKLKDNL
jgi:hypothetical protein